MAYQDVRRAKVLLSPPPDPAKAISQLYDEHRSLAFEVTECHSRIQQFSVLVIAGATTATITMPAPARTSKYFAWAMPGYNAGAIWISGRTTTQFTLNFVTLLGVNHTWDFLVIE